VNTAYSSEPLSSSRELVVELLSLAATPRRSADDALARRVLAHLCALDPARVREEAEQFALRSVAAAWSDGWQPTELVRQTQRATNATTARLALVVVAADHTRRQVASLDPRWTDQLDQLALPRVDGALGWLSQWAGREQLEWPAAIHALVAFLRCLAALPSVPILVSPPGVRARPANPVPETTRPTDSVLERVRALLAKAESTTFEAEAEAFTAKAQELMTRHAVDAAMVSAHAGRSDAPITVRLPIDDPYVGPKSLLLQFVAESSRCRAVSYDGLAMSAVVGFAADVAATEVLFTSLLVQAHTAMHASAATARAGAHTRSRAFRSAFLVGYAHRIAARLSEINADVLADVDADGSILPMLAARSSAVNNAVEEMFGALRRSTVRTYDPAGWVSGELAADRARLLFEEVPRGQANVEGHRSVEPSASGRRARGYCDQ
jgi:hypothetical protein